MKYFLLPTAGYSNKGDSLMIEGVLDRIKEYNNNSNVSIPIFYKFPKNKYSLSTVSCAHKHRNNWKHFIYRSVGNTVNSLLYILPKNLRKKFKLVRVKDIDVVLDTSGFYLGDQWPNKHMLKMVDSYKKYKKHGAKIILMPKAFGPINKEGTIALAKGLFSIADVIYARDKFSLSELEKHGIKGDKIKLCPDYSSVVKPQKDSNQEKYKGMVCLIPNFRFIDKSNITSDYYINSFVKIINNLRERGLESYFVIHSMIYDVDIAHKVNDQLDTKVDIIEEPDPKKLKGYIGQALFSISSRYHGIMNSLSQNVPSIGTSWNHKYVELYKEYGIIDLLVTEFSYEDILSKIDYLLSDNKINIAIDSIKDRNITVHEVVENMWSNVFDIIDK